MKRVQRQFSGLPEELIEPIGNLIRKIAYTQLSSIRLIGISISTNDNSMPWAMLTSTIEGTTTPLDIIPHLNNELKEGIVNSRPYLAPMITFTEERFFTDLKIALREFMDVSNVPDNLLITSQQHTVRLMFCRVDKDMDSRSLQAFMPSGFIPVPTTVLNDFKLDYSKKNEGILSYEVAAEFSEQLDAKITEIMGIMTQKN